MGEIVNVCVPAWAVSISRTTDLAMAIKAHRHVFMCVCALIYAQMHTICSNKRTRAAKLSLPIFRSWYYFGSIFIHEEKNAHTTTTTHDTRKVFAKTKTISMNGYRLNEIRDAVVLLYNAVSTFNTWNTLLLCSLHGSLRIIWQFKSKTQWN